ncbi:hypothetical protein B0O80DRAFT_43427 [Mortierella sp. GBAus27b]|nr:hypothetical protein BGX31_001606 [Mortierella sp. GBA43]KAI8355455.1 hypothetical protein B0O80DRAFT_43427 [Mortierella sp. GBAus27b]
MDRQEEVLKSSSPASSAPVHAAGHLYGRQDVDQLERPMHPLNQAHVKMQRNDQQVYPLFPSPMSKISVPSIAVSTPSSPHPHSDPRLLIPTLHHPHGSTPAPNSTLSPSPVPSRQSNQGQQHHHITHPPLSRSLPNPSTTSSTSNAGESTTCSTLTTATGHLAVPNAEKSSPRRWSITGRFFGSGGSDRASDRHKSATDSLHMPTQPYHCRTDKKSARVDPGDCGSIEDGYNSGDRRTGRSSRVWGKASCHDHHAKQSPSPDRRRSSFAELPKALFFPSFRRTSASSNDSKNSSMAAAAAAISSSIAAVIGSTSPRDDRGGGYMDRDHVEQERYKNTGRMDEKSSFNITMAAPKAPPRDPRRWSDGQLLPKSILKKRPSDVSVNPSGIVASVAIAGAGQHCSGVNLENIAPHRAKLETHSPPLSPLQHHPFQPENVVPIGGPGSPPHDVLTNGAKEDPKGVVDSSPRGDSAIPSEFTPGVQSNLYRTSQSGGEKPRRDQELSQAEMLDMEMISISTRDSKGNQGRQSAPQQEGPRRRSINFLDTIEIIPAHRKSDYNRGSDKHATFRMLTPDLKSEIRDELNTYKLREMPVHVDSMRNTAFH